MTWLPSGETIAGAVSNSKNVATPLSGMVRRRTGTSFTGGVPRTESRYASVATAARETVAMTQGRREPRPADAAPGGAVSNVEGSAR